MSTSHDSHPTIRTEEFLELYGRHDRALYAYILGMVPSWADADDIAQETRLRLWQQFSKYEPGSDFEAWARSIAYYLILTHRKKASRSRVRFGAAFYDAMAAEFAKMPRSQTSREEALSRCMEKLDETRRKLLREWFTSKTTLRELAERTGRSFDAMRMAVYRTQRVVGDCVELELGRKEVET